jgi:hypothetical protein
MLTESGWGQISNTTTTDDQTKGYIQAGLNVAIDQAVPFMGPYGIFIGAALKILVAVAMSYDSVDTCGDEDDAQEQGSRHEKTYYSLEQNLCRPIWDECEDEFFWGSCALEGYHYCCYDQLLTKILVQQIKAELGRESTNCTGISLRDLNYISFRQCTASEMASGIDGAKAYGKAILPSSHVDFDGPTYDPTAAFQYKHKCMDMTEFKEYLEAQMGEDLDMDTFTDYWNDLMQKSPY